MTKRSTKFTWEEGDVKIKEGNNLPQRLRNIIDRAPSMSVLKGRYYLNELKEGNLTEKELNFILDRGL